MAKRPANRFFAGGVLAAALLVGAIGIALGINSLSTPSLPESEQTWVTVRSTEPGTAVGVRWSMDSTGLVQIVVTSPVLPDAAPPQTPFDVEIFLYCDARFTDPYIRPAAEYAADLRLGYHASRGGNEALCRTNAAAYYPESEDPAIQMIVLEFPGGGVEGTFSQRITGRHVVPWTVASGGTRLSRTPAIYFDQSDGQTWEARVAMEASGTEALDYFQPASLSNGTVLTSIDAVTWQTTGEAPAGPYVQVPGTYARWVDTSGISTAQLSLLLSGALLGVSASLLVELVFDRARAAPSSGSSPAAIAGPRPFARRGFSRFQPAPGAGLSVPAARLGAALLIGGVVIMATSLVVALTLGGAEPGAEGGPAGVFRVVFFGSPIVVGAAFISIAVHYRTRPDRDGSVLVVLAATAGLLSLVLPLAAWTQPAHGWLQAALGAVLIWMGVRLVVAGTRTSRFSRSLRSPAVWLIAAGTAAVICGMAWLLDVVPGIAYLSFLLFWCVGLPGVAMRYARSASRLKLEKSAPRLLRRRSAPEAGDASKRAVGSDRAKRKSPGS